MANTALLSKIKFSPVDIEARKKLDFRAGDTIRVWSKIAEEKVSTKADKKSEKTIKFRLQAFEGMVLARKHGAEAGATFTVRKVASGVGVERIFPLYSPMIDRIEIMKKARARRSKLYYVRTKAVKDVRKKMRSSVVEEEVAEKATEKLNIFSRTIMNLCFCLCPRSPARKLASAIPKRIGGKAKQFALPRWRNW